MASELHSEKSFGSTRVEQEEEDAHEAPAINQWRLGIGGVAVLAFLVAVFNLWTIQWGWGESEGSLAKKVDGLTKRIDAKAQSLVGIEEGVRSLEADVPKLKGLVEGKLSRVSIAQETLDMINVPSTSAVDKSSKKYSDEHKRLSGEIAEEEKRLGVIDKKWQETGKAEGVETALAAYKEQFGIVRSQIQALTRSLDNRVPDPAKDLSQQTEAYQKKLRRVIQEANKRTNELDVVMSEFEEGIDASLNMKIKDWPERVKTLKVVMENAAAELSDIVKVYAVERDAFIAKLVSLNPTAELHVRRGNRDYSLKFGPHPKSPGELALHRIREELEVDTKSTSLIFTPGRSKYDHLRVADQAVISGRAGHWFSLTEVMILHKNGGARVGIAGALVGWGAQKGKPFVRILRLYPEK